MSSLTITPATGLNTGITNATSGGHDTLLLDPGVYTTGLTLSNNGARTDFLRITPSGEMDSVAINEITPASNWLQFYKCVFADGLTTDHIAVSTPLKAGAPGTGFNNGFVTFTPLTSSGTIIRVKYTDPEAVSHSPVTISVTNRDIEITLATDSSGVASTTGNQIIALVESSAEASALVTVANTSGHDGTGVVSPMPWLYLSNQLVLLDNVTNKGEHVEFVRCLLGELTIGTGSRWWTVANCEIRIRGSGLGVGHNMNSTDMWAQHTRIVANEIVNGYSPDAVIRPQRSINTVIERNYVFDCINPAGVTSHVDTIQTVTGGRMLRVRNNRFLKQEGQGMFISAADADVVFENNLIHTFAPVNQPNLFNQTQQARSHVYAHNTYTRELLFNTPNTNEQVVMVNNIFPKISVSGSSLAANGYHNYNLVDNVSSFSRNANEVDAAATYTDSTNYDYTLAAGSEGILDGTGSGWGTTYTLPPTDLAGNPRQGIYDCGCYQYKALGWLQEIGSAASTATDTSLVITISKNMKGLNHLILGVGTNQSTGAATITATDTHGNTYQTDRVHDHSTQSNNVFLLSCLPTTKLLIGDTITLTFTTSHAQKAATVHEFVGLASSSWLDQVNSAQAALGSSLASGNVTTTQAYEILIGVCNQQVGRNYVPSAGWTKVGDAVAGTFSSSRSAILVYRVVGTAGTYSITGTYDGPFNSAQIIASYKAA